MAWKGRQDEPTNIDQLLSSLNNSRIQTENNALYQTIQQIILFVQRNLNITNKTVSKLIGNVTNFNFPGGISIAGIINAIININTELNNATFITVDNETTNFPASVQELPGDAMDFDDSVPNQRTVNVLVDGITVTINGSNQLEASAADSLSPFLLMGA